METFISLAIPALLTVSTLRMLFLPIKAIYKTAIHTLSGFLCLWMLSFSGLPLSLNAATVLIAGFGGIPGTLLIVLLSTL